MSAVATSTFDRRETAPLLAEFPALRRRVQGALFPPSATMGQPLAAKRLPQPRCTRSGQIRVLSDTRISGLRREWESTKPMAWLAREIAANALAVKRTETESEFQRSVCALQEKADADDWSARELSRRAGLSLRTWGRIRAGRVNSETWLPKLRAAVAILKISSASLNSQLSTLNPQLHHG
jgi:hypothetical protein